MENKNIQEQENQEVQSVDTPQEVQDTQATQETQPTPANQEAQQATDPKEEQKAELAKKAGEAGLAALKGAGKVGAAAAKGLGKATVATAKVAGKAGVSAVSSGLVSAILPIALKVLLFTAIAGALGGAVAAVAKFVKEANKLEIADTPNVVEEIKKISELTTYTYIEEMVVKDTKVEAKEAGMLSFLHKSEVPDSTRSEIVIITRGVVRAGYDLAKIKDGDLKISNDTLSVVLPATEIFDVIINPSDNDIFVNSDKWSHEEITALQVDCKNRLLQNAHDNGVLEKADKHGKEKVENLFKTFGFNVVNVIQKGN
ncbi:MAG: DUF4230 domain-containing protein [Bacteroidaceae bacterium]|nr:DUF4230 domain-containing protein [Bacteroidaceae bacterium]